MEYHHYSDLCMPSEHLLTDPYGAEQYVAPYMLAGQSEAEYGIRSQVLVDGGDRFGVSAVVFDKTEELIWMGNQGGHVTSYYGPGMQKYTSFQIHESEEVRDIITTEQGIYALTKSMLRHQIRRGIPKHTHRSANMTDMQCLFHASTTNLMMGGHQDKLLDLDLTKMKETVISIPEEGCAVLRSGGGSLVACGSASGDVTLRDLRCPGAAEHSFRAHSACLSDLDMQGNLLITCGFTHSVNGVAVPEPYVMVWDVRRLRGNVEQHSWMAQTASPPLLLHFLPAFSGRAVAVAGDGLVTLLHVNSANETENQSVFQVDTQSSACSVMDVANTSQALVFGDQTGHLHLFSPQHNHEPVFNNFSRETEFADPPPGLPFVSLRDSSFQFGSVPLPPLAAGKWFNELPEEFFRKFYRKPKPIDAEVLKTMKMQGPIGYAPNPRTFRRNQMPYVEDTLEDLNLPRHEMKMFLLPVPKIYQKMELRFNKHAQNDLDPEIINKTGFPGLEPTIPNSYCNPMLQVLYYTPPVKATLLAHACAKEFCLSCELGFLFRMLDASGGAACQATNFLRAFRTVREAAALGLILPDRGHDARVDLVALIQSWNRFILHQMHYEILETRKKEKELAHLAQNASSPPKGQRIGNVAASKPPGILASPPGVNGHFVDEYNYSELEFLGPNTEFDQEEFKEGEEGWHMPAGGTSEEDVQSISDENTQTTKIRRKDLILKPWITKSLLNCIRKRDAIHMQQRKNPLNSDLAEDYKKYRNVCRESTRVAKALYYRNLITENISDPLRCWQLLNEYGGTSNSKTSKINVSKLFAILEKDYPNESALNKLKEYFQNMSEIDGQQLPSKEETDDMTCEVAAAEPPELTKQNESIEISNKQEREESEISQLFAITRRQYNTCLKCNKEEERESVVLACALQYPPPTSIKENQPDVQGGFVELLLASLSSRRSTPAWCETCARFSPTLQRGRVVRLPPILAINCGGVTAHEKAYWSKGSQKEMGEGMKRGGSGKPCRYGLHCARPGCRFKHPDRPGSSSQSGRGVSKSETRESHCVLPQHLLITLSADGDITINDKTEASQDQAQLPNKSNTSTDKQRSFTDTTEEYSLSAAVICVEDTLRHLVAYIHTQSAGEPSWYLLNDLSIIPVSAEEVVQCAAWWKTPCVAFYCTREATAPTSTQAPHAS